MSQSATQPQSITLLLRQIELSRHSEPLTDGDKKQAEEQLYSRVQLHFRRVAAKLLSNQPSHRTPPMMQVVDDAFLKLLNQQDVRYNDRKHFLRAAALTMRRIIVDHFRSLNTDKRRIDQQAIPLSGEVLTDLRVGLPCQIVELEDLIQSLEAKYPQAMQALVFSRFMRMTYEEIADTMDLTVHQVESLIQLAKAKIRRAIRSE